MPLIGIVRGVNEGFIATEHLMKILRALNRRMRSKINVKEIPVGNREFGYELTQNSINEMEECDVLIVSDISEKSSFLEYDENDIAVALGNNLKMVSISGLKSFGNVDIKVFSYYDGGSRLRENLSTEDGVSETRICSTYAAMGIAKYITRMCESRRRRIYLIKDDDNAYCEALFYKKFNELTAPLSNFNLFRESEIDLFREVLFAPSQFDVIFASGAVQSGLCGLLQGIMGENYASYAKFSGGKNVYFIKSVCNNSSDFKYVPSLYSYIIALSDLLMDEFGMRKEQVCLRMAVENAMELGKTMHDSHGFVEEIINQLDNPIKTKFPKNSKSTLRYIK